MRFLTLSVAIVCMTLWSGRKLEAQPMPVDTGNLLYAAFLHGSYLGVKLADVDADRARALKLPQAEGVEVTEVEPGSPAEKAGLHPGDVLLTYNGENILGAEHLARLVAETPKDRRIEIRYSRDGHEHTAFVVTGARAQSMMSYRGFSPTQPSEFFHHFNMPDMPAPLLLWKTSIGIECEPVDSQLARYFGVSHGVLVRSVEKNSAGEKAGLRAGDVVTLFGNRSVSSPKDVTGILRAHPSGKPIPVTITRGHRQMQVTIKPSANAEQ